ncbi:MAG: formate dehydrogenase accessory sulfurtransferase FdhD [Acetobacteraceae bacterium]
MSNASSRLSPARSLPRLAWRGGMLTDAPRMVAEEAPVALTYGRATHAVMLATPSDLEDFAIGFSLSEGIIAAPSEIEALSVVELPDGIELRMDLAASRQATLTRRQRRMAGASGCGLCGMESLADAIRPVPAVGGSVSLTAQEVVAAIQTMHGAQRLNEMTRAMHAAGFWTRSGGLVAVREDVGRHNALDKLSGALTRSGVDAGSGVLLLSSRVSVEMVQKAAILGAPVIVAVSAPTALAVRIADRAGITLIGIARPDGFEIFSHPHRISAGPVHHVA